MTDPATTPPASSTVFAVDCDRTLTGDDLVPDRDALAAIAELRNAGVRCVLVTGRSREHLATFAGMEAAFDAYAFEGGAVWGTWDNLLWPSNQDVALRAADGAEQAGIPIQRRTASFSAPLERYDAVRALAPDCSIEVNVDRIDVLPPRLDKGTGLDGALAAIGCRAAHVVAIGDGQNDIPLFARAHVGLAVANATTELKEAADEILAAPGPAGVIDAVRRMLLGEWRTPGPVPAAAA